jgi:hypothetical protein
MRPTQHPKVASVGAGLSIAEAHEVQPELWRRGTALFYLYLADVSVPLLGTSIVETPQISGRRAIVHFILCLLCFYFGFVRRPKA